MDGRAGGAVLVEKEGEGKEEEEEEAEKAKEEEEKQVRAVSLSERWRGQGAFICSTTHSNMQRLLWNVVRGSCWGRSSFAGNVCLHV